MYAYLHSSLYQEEERREARRIWGLQRLSSRFSSDHSGLACLRPRLQESKRDFLAFGADLEFSRGWRMLDLVALGLVCALQYTLLEPRSFAVHFAVVPCSPFSLRTSERRAAHRPGLDSSCRSQQTGEETREKSPLTRERCSAIRCDQLSL